MNPEITVDVLSPAFKENPYPGYAQLRAHAPVYPVSMPERGITMWLITRYDDALAALKDERLIKDGMSLLSDEQRAAMPPVPDSMKPLARMMLDIDGEEHRRVRGLVHRAFTPALVEAMRDRVTAIAESLIADALPNGQMELIAEFAYLLPITVITEILGVALSDRAQFRQWSNAIVNQGIQPDPAVSMQAAQAMTTFLRQMVAERRASPRDDLLSRLIQAEEQGDMLSEDELLSLVFLLLIAGHETTVNLIGNGILALLRHPDQLEQLRREPALMRTAIEELLRYDSPVELATERYAREDMELQGAHIKRGDLVLVGLGAANHDPAHFTNPDELDITRVDNKHLAFGQGVHYCVGAPLARLEGAIAIRLLLDRLPNLSLAVAPETLEHNPSIILRGLKTLPVKF